MRRQLPVLTRRLSLKHIAFAVAALLVSNVPLPALAQESTAAPLKIFAAASLKNALDDAASAYTKKTGQTFSISYAASSALAKQIEQVAPADVYSSADLDCMN